MSNSFSDQNDQHNQQRQTVVTRFAPSPTGYIHIGNVRSAIYPYLIAKQNRGRFILRIEDTDQKRYVEGATELIKDTLRWLGLDWDEGADYTTINPSAHSDGPHAPYFQSQRKQLYQDAAKSLILKGRAYVDTTTPEEVEAFRKDDAAKKVPYLFRNHRPESASWTSEQTLDAWKEGLPLRFKSEPKSYAWHDEVMGDMHTGPEVCDDIILIKKDGLPTYNFAHIIDDADMKVTHIARGVEYLSSMPNYLALYEALGFDTAWRADLPQNSAFRPLFLSLPHILAPTGNKKLGKRDGAKSVTEYRNDGILPEAMLNYLACLGWNDGTEEEIYTKDDLIAKFSIDRIQSSGARFDETKILWYNGIWIRKIASEQGIDALFRRTSGFWPESAAAYPEEYRIKVLSIIYDRLKTLSELRSMTAYFFRDPTIDLSELTGHKMLKRLSEQELISLLSLTIDKLSGIAEESWTEDHLQQAFNDLLETTGKKPGELFTLIRIAISFAPFSPALHLTVQVLGKNVTLSRLNAVRTALSNG